jgi:hypothetical protein
MHGRHAIATFASLLVACGGATQSAAPAPSVAAAPPPAPTATTEDGELVCPLSVPDEVSAHASVLHVPQDLFNRAVTPVVAAVCTCAAHGQQLTLAVRITPALGEVRATTADDPAVDACLKKLLSPGRYEAFEVDATAAPGAPGSAPAPQQALDPNRPERLAAFHQGPPPPARAAPAAAQPAPRVIALALTFSRP